VAYLNKMKVELKSIKHCQALSHETNAFTAKVYVNGKHVGDAENAGHGGPTHVQTAWKGKKDEQGCPIYSDADKEAVDKLHKWAEKNNEYDIEGLIEDLLMEELWWRDFTKDKRTKLLYLREGSVWFISRKGIPASRIKSGELEGELKKTKWWKPEYVFLNNVKKPEFIAKYKEAWIGGNK